MEISPDQPQEELLAIRVRHVLDLGHGRIDPIKVARALGLEVVQYPVEDDGVEGQFRPITGSRGAIFVNSHCSRLRQRFTVAHEIGHALLHPLNVVVDDDLTKRSNLRVERQADRFAGALLVDPTAAGSIVARCSGDLDTAIAEIVAEFDVSVPTAAISLNQFGFVTRAEINTFMKQYQDTGHRRFMEQHGHASRHRTGSGKLVHDPAFRSRVVNLLARGQLNPERAAELLGGTVQDLPERAVASYAALAAELIADPDFA